MEELNSSLLLLNNTSKDAEYPDNITIPPDESNGTTDWEYTTADLILIVSYIIIIIFWLNRKYSNIYYYAKRLHEGCFHMFLYVNIGPG